MLFNRVVFVQSIAPFHAKRNAQRKTAGNHVRLRVAVLDGERALQPPPTFLFSGNNFRKRRGRHKSKRNGRQSTCARLFLHVRKHALFNAEVRVFPRLLHDSRTCFGTRVLHVYWHFVRGCLFECLSGSFLMIWLILDLIWWLLRLVLLYLFWLLNLI